MLLGSEKQLQYPRRVEPLWLKNLVEAKLQSLGYKETQPSYSLSTELELLYDGLIKSILTMNSLLDSDEGDLETVAKAAVGLRWDLDDAGHHIGSSVSALEQLADHLYGMLEDDEDDA